MNKSVPMVTMAPTVQMSVSVREMLPVTRGMVPVTVRRVGWVSTATIPAQWGPMARTVCTSVNVNMEGHVTLWMGSAHVWVNGRASGVI